MTKLVNSINLIVGDWSHDGHSMTDTIAIKSNLTKEEIKNAYKQGVKTIGIDLSKDICTEYDVCSISKEQFDKFISLGFVPSWMKKYKPERLAKEFSKIDLDFIGEFFVEMYLFTVKLGNSDFEYEIEDECENEINIGGYGLFSN